MERWVKRVRGESEWLVVICVDSGDNCQYCPYMEVQYIIVSRARARQYVRYLHLVLHCYHSC